MKSRIIKGLTTPLGILVTITVVLGISIIGGSLLDLAAKHQYEPICLAYVALLTLFVLALIVACLRPAIVWHVRVTRLERERN